MIGRPEHAYSISVKQEQLSKLQSFLPSIDRSFDAVLIHTRHQGHMYMIVYAADAGEMGYFQDTFQNILSSVSFSPTSGGIGSSKNILPIPTNQYLQRILLLLFHNLPMS